MAGGYAFRIQAVGSKNFTVRVYDDDLSELGKSIMRAEGKTEDEIADEVSEKLKAVGQEFRSRMPGTSFQDLLEREDHDEGEDHSHLDPDELDVPLRLSEVRRQEFTQAD